MTQRSKSSVWRRRSLPERAVKPLLAAGACAAGLVVVYLAAFHVGPTARADTRLFFDFTGLEEKGDIGAYAAFVVRFFNPKPFAIAVLIVLAAAAWLRGARVTLAVAAIFLGANLSTQLLKTLTAAPRNPLWLADASWPSGHVTAAASLALCVVLIAPAALRPYAIVAGALGVLATAVSLMVVRSHLPSDVLAGMLMAGAWTGLAIAALEFSASRRGAQRLLRRAPRPLSADSRG